MSENKKKDTSESYMTVGTLAKKMGTTVRTLQYYDREGLLAPSAESAGGRRLYTYRDMVRLHQILSLKSLGFSLDDIKNRLIPLDTPEEVAEALNRQEESIREQIGRLTEALQAVEALKEEVLQIQTVDFKKYADIIVNLQMNNEYYWLIKHFDEEMLDHIRSRFDRESGQEFMDRFHQLNERAMKLMGRHVGPGEEAAQELAADFWRLVQEFTDGDMSLFPKLMELGKLDGGGKGSGSQKEQEWAERQRLVNAYLEPALELYFSKSGGGPSGPGRTEKENGKNETGRQEVDE